MNPKTTKILLKVLAIILLLFGIDVGLGFLAAFSMLIMEIGWETISREMQDTSSTIIIVALSFASLSFGGIAFSCFFGFKKLRKKIKGEEQKMMQEVE